MQLAAIQGTGAALDLNGDGLIHPGEMSPHLASALLATSSKLDTFSGISTSTFEGIVAKAAEKAPKAQREAVERTGKALADAAARERHARKAREGSDLRVIGGGAAAAMGAILIAFIPIVGWAIALGGVALAGFGVYTRMSATHEINDHAESRANMRKAFDEAVAEMLRAARNHAAAARSSKVKLSAE